MDTQVQKFAQRDERLPLSLLRGIHSKAELWNVHCERDTGNTQ